MIPRYTLPEMAELWSDQHRFSTWLEVELLAVEGWASIGVIPEGAAAEVRAEAGFSLERIRELEAITDHDVAAFVGNVAETAGTSGRWIHFGLTSSDVVDTALAVVLTRAVDLIAEKLDVAFETVREKAFEQRATACAGRTHGMHAEPTTFGAKLAGWAFEIDRDRGRLARARDAIATGKISGAVGTYGAADPRVEAYVCEHLGLRPEPAATQIVARDRHAEVAYALASIAAGLERFAQEIRHLQRTEVAEAEEPFKPGQKGSSAMPHKRNPITCERICGLARVVRSDLIAALEDVALWHERDISHSSVERVILPDMTVLVHYMLDRFTAIVAGLRVDAERMRSNLNLSGGRLFSQRVLLALVAKGMSREEAYRAVQGAAMAPHSGEVDFRERLEAEPAVAANLSAAELDACFDLEEALHGLGTVFERLKGLP